MPRPPRLQFPGALYHVSSRGNKGASIFPDERDRDLFLHELAETVRRYRWLCHSYCLMGNHYHLLVETTEPNLAAGAQRLNGAYAQELNRTYGQRGHVFQGRYHAVLVEKESHLLEVARYIVLNPVRARLCGEARDWKWSSYRATAGLAARPGFLAFDWILSQFGGDPRAAETRYRSFVADGAGSNPWRHSRGTCLGSEAFLQEHRSPIQGSDPGV